MGNLDQPYWGRSVMANDDFIFAARDAATTFDDDDEPDFSTDNEDVIAQLMVQEKELESHKQEIAGLGFVQTLQQREAEKLRLESEELNKKVSDLERKVETGATNRAVDAMLSEAKTELEQLTPDYNWPDDEDEDEQHDDLAYSVDSRSVAHWFGGARKLQIYKFRTAAVDTWVKADEFFFKKVSDTTVQRVDWQHMINAVYHDTGFHKHIDTWAVNYHPHSEHSNFSDDKHARPNTPYMRVDTGGSAKRNSCDTKMVIGDNDSVLSIRPAKRKLYNSTGDTCFVYADTNYVKVVGQGIQVNDTGNFWKTSRYRANVTGAYNLTAGAASTWIGPGITVNPVAVATSDLSLGYSKGWLNVKIGGRNITLSGDDAGNLYLGEGTSMGFAKVYLNGKEIKQILQSEFDPMAHKILVVDA